VSKRSERTNRYGSERSERTHRYGSVVANAAGERSEAGK